MTSRRLAVVALMAAVAVAGLNGCGQSGPLTLPDRTLGAEPQDDQDEGEDE